MFPMVKPPNTEDGLGIIILNSNAETHFSFTNALGWSLPSKLKPLMPSRISTPTPVLDRRSPPSPRRVSEAREEAIGPHRHRVDQWQLAHAASGTPQCDPGTPQPRRWSGRRIRAAEDGRSFCSYSRHVKAMRKNMRMTIVVFSCLLTAMGAQEASAAIKRFPSCPEGVVDKTCQCHSIVSGRPHICHAGQRCIRHSFNGSCR